MITYKVGFLRLKNVCWIAKRGIGVDEEGKGRGEDALNFGRSLLFRCCEDMFHLFLMQNTSK